MYFVRKLSKSGTAKQFFSPTTSRAKCRAVPVLVLLWDVSRAYYPKPCFQGREVSLMICAGFCPLYLYGGATSWVQAVAVGPDFSGFVSTSQLATLSLPSQLVLLNGRGLWQGYVYPCVFGRRTGEPKSLPPHRTTAVLWKGCGRGTRKEKLGFFFFFCLFGVLADGC